MNSMVGSYLDKGRSLLGESINVIILDTFVAIFAGLIIGAALAGLVYVVISFMRIYEKLFSR